MRPQFSSRILLPRRLLRLALVLVPLLAAASAQADAPADRWEKLADPLFLPLSTQDGLQSMSTQCISQDGQGFIWIGTDNGLARWDGYAMRTYTPIPGQNNSLPGMLIDTLAQDSAGQLWIGSADAGLARYNPQNDDFTAALLPNGAPARLEIRAIRKDPAGGLWVGGAGGLYHVDTAQPVTPILQPDSAFARIAPRQNVVAILPDRAGALWVATFEGLYRRLPHQTGFAKIPLTDPIGKNLGIASLFQDSAGLIWIGTINHGAYTLNPAEGLTPHAHPWQEQQAGSGQMQTLLIEDIMEVAPGQIWLATPGYGIFAVDTGTKSLRHILHDPTRPFSLISDAVMGFFRDSANNVWIATDHGVDRYAPGHDGFVSLFGETGRQNGLSDPDIFAIYAAPDGSVWAGLEHNGVDILQPQTGQITHMPAGRLLPNTLVSGIEGSPQAGVFIGTWQGLFRTQDNGQTVSQISLPGPPARLSVTAMARRGDTIFLANTSGIMQLDLAAAAHAPPQVVLTVPAQQLSDNRIICLLPDPSGKIWVGTYNGLNLTNPATGQVQQWHAGPATDPNALTSNVISSLVRDAQGRLWAATVGGGINIIAENQPIRRIGLAEGLPKTTVDKLLLGQDGAIWAGTDDGVVRIDPKTLKIRAFHASDGVAIPATWVNSGTSAPHGELLFGGTGGITIARPDQLSTLSTAPPHLVITSLHVGNQTLPAAQFNTPGPHPPLILQPDQRSLAIEFSALSYTDAGRMLYAYRLPGVDQSWQSSDAAHRLAMYTNLPPGNFTLELRATDPDNPALQTSLRLPLQVRPAWFQSWWFAALCAIALIALVFLAVRLQNLRLRARQLALERLVDSRTRELHESNAALMRSAESLREMEAIGQEITASLDVDTVLGVLHAHLTRLFGAEIFAVYLARRPSETPYLRFGMSREGQLITAVADPAEDESLVHEAMASRTLVVRRSPPARQTLVCAPLIVQDRVIGAMLLRAVSLTQGECARESLILRSIATYGAIALDNAEAVKALADLRTKMQELAYSDGLTKLPNRRMYLEQFDKFRARAQESATPFTLLLIDLDNFKQINDTYGHDTGDATLVETARRLQSVVRGRDCVMRLGGDEFAILLAETGSLDAIDFICKRIAESFEWPLRFNDLAVQASTSIGAAIFPEDGLTHEQLYKAADLAMYAAKRAGRCTWRKFTPEIATHPRPVTHKEPVAE